MKLFVCFDSLPYFPDNNFSIMSGGAFLGLTSYKQQVKCLAQGDNTATSPAVRFKLQVATIQAPVIYRYFLFTALASICLAERDRLFNFGRGHYEDKEA